MLCYRNGYYMLCYRNGLMAIQTKLVRSVYMKFNGVKTIVRTFESYLKTIHYFKVA